MDLYLNVQYFSAVTSPFLSNLFMNMAHCTYPAFPLLSILLASSTSLEYTSNCHCLWPSTPARTAPVCMPTLMSTGEFVVCWRYLRTRARKVIQIIAYYSDTLQFASLTALRFRVRPDGFLYGFSIYDAPLNGTPINRI